MFDKVENTTYSKNSKTGNIVNNDIAGYNARRRVINKGKKQDNKIANLENEVKDMRAMLQQLIEAKTT